MTKNSLICNIINDHPNDWREYFAENYDKIIIKSSSNLSLFVYGIEANFNDPVVQEARGIIINTETCEVVCWPFRKFGKYYESYADKIDWTTARVQEKIDGSIVKLWYNKLTNNWVWSTNSMIDANDANIDETKTVLFMDIIKQADNFHIIQKSIDDNALLTDITYIFELVSPHTSVVIKHRMTRLFHIGTRSNITGKEMNADIGIAKPREFGIDNIDDCIKYADVINRNTLSHKIDVCYMEGFVVVDANWNRIKVKSPIYVVLHNIFTGSSVSKKLLIQLIHEDAIYIDSICKEFPDRSHWIRYYDFKYKELIWQLSRFINITRKIYEDSGNDRKAVANIIKGHKFAPLAFRALDNKDDIFTLMDNMAGGLINILCKYIPDYEPENFSWMFKAYYHSKEEQL